MGAAALLRERQWAKSEDAPGQTDATDRSLSELRALGLRRIGPPSFIPAFISRLLSLSGKVSPRGDAALEADGRKGLLSN